VHGAAHRDWWISPGSSKGFAKSHFLILHHASGCIHDRISIPASRAGPDLGIEGFILPGRERAAVLALGAGGFCKRFGEHYGTWVFAKSHCL